MPRHLLTSTSRGKPRGNPRASKRKTAHGTLQPLPLRRLFFFFTRYSFAQWVCFPRFFPRIWVDISASAYAKPNRVPQGPAHRQWYHCHAIQCSFPVREKEVVTPPGLRKGQQMAMGCSLTEASTTVPACLYQATVSPLSNLLLFSLLLITFQPSSSIVFDSSNR